MSALAGLRDEAESLVRARIDEAIRRLDLVKREELDAIQELAANARVAQESAEGELAMLRHRIAELEARVSALETPPAAQSALQSAVQPAPDPGPPEPPPVPPSPPGTASGPIE